ncbi:fungal-specific transcription factor [Dactylonectria macrodidyma]|uniref:Fungal-specific transcription factor n=1 Tax=Dactylonectria macrodidyma TaxID=307937 RepID=A0A9P9JIU6_9HYPO|nr:fungal-specific transcription factor [Dactylonectria macrodidyma]
MPQKGACDSCHKRKVQCYGPRPPCTRCKHHGLPCTFDRPQRATSRTRVASSGDVSNGTLSQRMRRIEHFLNSAHRGLQPPGAGRGSEAIASAPCPPTFQTTNPLARVKIHFAGFYLGHIGSFNGVPFISESGRAWMQSRTGDGVCLDKLCAAGPQWQANIHPPPLHQLSSGSSQLSDDVPVLPARRMVEHFFALYCSTNFYRAMPVLDPLLFRSTLNEAYADSSIAATGPKAHIFAFMMFVSEFQHEWGAKPSVEHKVFEAKLTRLTPAIMGDVDITSAQTFMMLTICCFFRGHEEQGATYHAIACRHLLALGAHIPPAYHSGPIGTDTQQREQLIRQHLRRLFWTAFICDKEICLRTGRPPTIDDDYCDLTLPAEPHHDGIDELENLTLNPRAPLRAVGWRITDLQLAIIRSHVGKGLYSVSALQKTDTDLLRTVRELDDELERWRLSVPLTERPVLGCHDRSKQPGIGPDICRHAKLRNIFLQFHYLHLVAMIRQASHRCRDWTQGKEEGQKDLRGISSSITISVLASRATLDYLRLALDSPMTDSSWLILFYPIVAVLNLFCNILLDPLDPAGVEDLDLVSSVPRSIRILWRRPTIPAHELWFPFMDEFIDEVVRLGRCAIDRAMNQATDDANQGGL